MQKKVLCLLLLTVAIGWSVAAGEYEASEFDDHYHLTRGEGLFGDDFDKKITRVKKSLERFGATDAQVSEAVMLLENSASSREQQYEEISELKQQIQDEYNNTNPDRARLERLIMQAAEAQGKMHFTSLTIALDMRAIVGDDVWKKMTRNHGYHDDDDDHRRRGRGRGRSRR